MNVHYVMLSAVKLNLLNMVLVLLLMIWIESFIDDMDRNKLKTRKAKDKF